MNSLVAIVRLMLFVLLLPVRIFTAMQYLNALIFYEKDTLTLGSKWRIGHHVINNKNERKCIVLWHRKIDRGRCPAWYTTYVALKPCKK